MSKNNSECVKVVVRCRPFNSKEKAANEGNIIQCDTQLRQVYVSKPGETGQPPKTFSFDNVFPPTTTQQAIWEQSAKSIVDSVLAGYNGTIFAYGQTGTGKTFTMEGDVKDSNARGIMPNAFYHVMEAVENAASNMEFLIRASFLEIYNNQVYDLLGSQRQKMEVREKKGSYGKMEVFVKGLSTVAVNSTSDLMRVLYKGQKIRKTGATGMNAGSSRSHSIFTMTIESSEMDESGEKKFKVGKLNMVDLAGSERQKKTGATNERLVEGSAINASLSALGNVIKALVSKGSKHVPFRDSKLTRLLQNSLGGNTKTVMVAAIGPAAWNFEETMSTLRYASRAKSIKNKPRVNEDPKDAMLKKCQDEIEALRRQLMAAKGGGAIGDYGAAGGEGGGSVETKTVIKEVVKNTGFTKEDKEKIKAEILEKHKAEQRHTKDMARVMMLRKKGEEEAAKKLEAELEAKKKAIDAEKARMEDIERKLKEKAKLLMKGQKTLEAARLQKAKLQKAEEKLARQKEEEEKTKRRLESAKERALFLEQKYANNTEELQDKTKKLKELFLLYREKQRDLADLQEEWDVERLDLLENIRELDQQLKLRDLILEHYVPNRWLKEIEERSNYNEHTDEWFIPGLQHAANNLDEEQAHRQREGHQAMYNKLARQGKGAGPFDPLAAQQQQFDEDAIPPKESPFYTYGVEIKKRRKKKSKKKKSKR